MDLNSNDIDICSANVDKKENSNHIKENSIYNSNNIQRQNEIIRVLDIYQIKYINNKKKRKLIEMNEEAFQSYELSLKIAKCCKVVCF